MTWFNKKPRTKTIYFDLYYYIKRDINTDSSRMITLDRISFAQTIHINDLKHKKIPLVKYEF